MTLSSDAAIHHFLKSAAVPLHRIAVASASGLMLRDAKLSTRSEQPRGIKGCAALRNSLGAVYDPLACDLACAMSTNASSVGDSLAFNHTAESS